MTPGVLVAGNQDAQDAAADDGDATEATATPAATKPSTQVDEQLTKALDILKAKKA